jgi:hypothetical protein
VALQLGGWAWGLKPLTVKKLFTKASKERKHYVLETGFAAFLRVGEGRGGTCSGGSQRVNTGCPVTEVSFT